jgi:ATP-dependent RNA helicase DeaD
VDTVQRWQLNSVAKQYGIDMEERPVPTEEDVEKIASERVIALLEAKLRALDGLVQERMKRMLPIVGRLSDSEDERKLLAMLVDEYYQAALHAPPEAPNPPPPRRERDRDRPPRSSSGPSKRPPRRRRSGGGRGGRSA